MDSNQRPSDYQLFGRTIQVWNTHRETPPFAPGHPWLLRHFDQIRFFEVGEAELEDVRAKFLHGKYPLPIEAQTFSLDEYRAFWGSRDRGTKSAAKQPIEIAHIKTFLPS